MEAATFTSVPPPKTSQRTDPTDAAGRPLASGVPTVSMVEVCCGGAQEGKASGAPCWRFGAVH